MPMQISPVGLAERINQLQAQRQEHAESIEQIDQALQQIQSLVDPLIGRRGAPVKTKTMPVSPAAAAPTRGGRRRKRRKYELTAEESILKFVQERGDPSTGEIVEYWRSEGRGGKADNALTKLVADKKLNRETNTTGRGSRYTVRGAARSSGSIAPAIAPAKAAGTRRQYSMTGEEFVLQFVRQRKQPITGDINAAWRGSGRSGRADKTLGKLVAEGKLRREDVEEGRGSKYVIA
jgi:hypothetical protein